MSDLSLRSYFKFAKPDDGPGVRSCCAPGLKKISLRALMTALRIIHISDVHFFQGLYRLVTSGYAVNCSQQRSAVISSWLIKNRERIGGNVIITGDITDSGDPGDYDVAVNFIQTLTDAGFAVYVVPGNHDYCKEGLLCNFYVFGGSYARRRRFVNRITQYNDYPHVIALNNGYIILLDSMKDELDKIDDDSDSEAQGRLGSTQRDVVAGILDTLQAERAKGKTIVVCLHHSPFCSEDTLRLDDAGQFIECIRNRVDCLLYGHTTRDDLGIYHEPTRLPGDTCSNDIEVNQLPTAKGGLGVPLINCENLENVNVAVISPSTVIGGEAEVTIHDDSLGPFEPNTYPITVIDLGCYQRVVFYTDGSSPRRTFGAPPQLP